MRIDPVLAASEAPLSVESSRTDRQWFVAPDRLSQDSRRFLG